MPIKKHYLGAVSIFGLPLLLCSCIYGTTNPPATTPPDQLTVICQNLRQDILMNDNDGQSPMNENGPSPTKAAVFYKQYDENNCDEVINRNLATPMKPTK